MIYRDLELETNEAMRQIQYASLTEIQAMMIMLSGSFQRGLESEFPNNPADPDTSAGVAAAITLLGRIVGALGLRLQELGVDREQEEQLPVFRAIGESMILTYDRLIGRLGRLYSGLEQFEKLGAK